MKISFLIFLSVSYASATQIEKFAYIGDSQVALGGIGSGLTCLNPKNIIAFGNAKASTYVGGERCRLFGSYHSSDRGNLCDLAKVRFRNILATSVEQINTVVVALGDNINTPATFRMMLGQIRNSGKECVWIIPAEKIGNNANTHLALETLTDIVKQICGPNNFIDPSSDGSTYKTIEDQVHYQPLEGRKIGTKICTELQRMDLEFHSSSVIPSGDKQ